MELILLVCKNVEIHVFCYLMEVDLSVNLATVLLLIISVSK